MEVLRPDTVLRNGGRCAMRGSCGPKEMFGKPLPCPYDGSPSEDDVDRELLTTLCGEDFAQGPVCCKTDQLQVLRDNLGLAENLISACPACRNNFRKFWCSFTCSPDQSNFVHITETQKSSTGKTAVKTADFFVSEEFGNGFYDSCKQIKLGATNGYVMDLLGGGAKNYHEFFKFMGEEKDMGSPFTINFPSPSADDAPALNATVRNCYDSDLGSKCTCIDCEQVCPALPTLPPPGAAPTCHVGYISCLTFILVISYGVAVSLSYERVALSSDTDSQHVVSPRTHARGLVGASSLAQYIDGEGSTGTQSESRRLGRGASLLDPIETVQPRHYRLNNFLRRTFYRIGLFSSTYPWLNFAIVFSIMGLLNLGWRRFEIETDPVRLWVAPDSEAKLQKEFFDEHFGPFYRIEQVFVTSTNGTSLDDRESVLSWEHLQYWAEKEAAIRQLRSSPNDYVLDDLCLKPAGPDGFCVVQSIMAWYGNDLSDYDPDTWADRLVGCAQQPVNCLPDFQQPLTPALVLGKVPENEDGEKGYLDAKALIITFVVRGTLDPVEEAKAMEWEPQRSAPEEAGLEIAWLVGVSIEEEINKSTNTDIKIVVLSYVAMFFYVAFTLGNGSSIRDEDGPWASMSLWARNLPKFFSHGTASSTLSLDSRTTPTVFPRLPRGLFVGSKFTLGLFGIALVILSVSSSVGLFSFIGVIPFLVLAVGVDNVFILVHELDRQNLLHGPNATTSITPVWTYSDTPMSPTQSRRGSTPQYLGPEERVARTLAKMGPSILLSTVTETTAFALGALVPMPAVRNFALYAAGSVFLNALLQITVFVSAMVIDLRRVEASRVDCVPCLRLPPRIVLLEAPPTGSGLSLIARFIRKRYAPFLLKPAVKGAVLLIFGGVMVASIISVQNIKLGFDQRLAFPPESNLIKVCGRFTTCDPLSVASMLELERGRPEVSYIAQPAASWLDEYFNWLDPNKEKCCRDHEPAWNITMDGLPEGDEFMMYLKQWLAAYGDALALTPDGAAVAASHFRTYHTPMKGQADFINSLAAARRVADDLAAQTGAQVFPYSPHYVFFDQFAHIVAITEQILGLGLAAVLFVTALLLGSWRTGTIVTGVVALTFCAHVARAFMSAGTGLPVDHPAGQKERDERMWIALVDVGPSVLSGITFTKLIGMCVLALTRSKFLEIYYFRMWITLIISGALHGGSGFPQQEADEEWMSHAIRNDYEYTPFLADDDSVSSD
ncbi:multidrug efflux transporter AcrB transmembrane domain-containing protein [Epithele typhae]|uniref:multidrug efflux transporter AcrB transmembrane domain-containing protein n=1 Tax=Epithele typhae TaxID=378194 RepID=UPI002007AA78|nr:multidrug efflux transporter AcrB transmembrane domain-containing protein [Epithele typhae]KAH9918241.1 multidrug efflux transporter AcrB transmembrane domain-containing protein [Epithele typhae]